MKRIHRLEGSGSGAHRAPAGGGVESDGGTDVDGGIESDGGVEAAVGVRLGDFVLDVDLQVPRGGIVAVMGPNGSGKTTLLRCLAGLLALESGRIVLHSDVVDDPGTGIWVPPEQRSIGYAFQDVRLFGHLSALDNVAFGLRWGKRGRLGRWAARPAARQALAAVGLEHLSGVRPSRLSGGQAQRVSLARALAEHPSVLLLDEPFSATDAEVRPLLRQLVRKQAHDYDATVVLVTHDPADAEALADRVVVLEGGHATT